MGEGKEKSQCSSSVYPAACPYPCPLPQVLEYNAIGGKYQRGLTVLIAFQELAEPKKQDADSLQRALTVGWCVELVRGVGKGGRKSGLQEWVPGWEGEGWTLKPVCSCLCFCASRVVQPNLDSGLLPGLTNVETSFTSRCIFNL